MASYAPMQIKMKKIILLTPVRKKENYQFFMDWFADAWISCGGQMILGRQIPWLLRLYVAKLRLVNNIPFLTSNTTALLIPGAGYPDSFAWPYSYTHEIIPMLWDVWPRYWERLLASLKRNHVRTCLCTSSQVCAHIKEHLPHIHVLHVPEGINEGGYQPGLPLKDRAVDILELGRQMPFFHAAAVQWSSHSQERVHLYQKEGEALLFPDFPSLSQGLSSAKLTVSYPRCDTHPEMAGPVETLTQRYWECMLSGTLPVGRAPQELIDFLGYNPVVEISNQNTEETIAAILTSIDSYQDLVDKNLLMAQRHAPWTARMATLQEQLLHLGYQL